MGGPHTGTKEWALSIRGQNLMTKIPEEGNVQRLRWTHRQGVYLRDICQQTQGLQSLGQVLTKAWQDPILLWGNYQHRELDTQTRNATTGQEQCGHPLHQSLLKSQITVESI